MAEQSRAVFLSYASDDADAALRICTALRGAGIEVWFDQSELRGGDSWDAAIRKHIKTCALFVPVISASTQARAEGYFRLEWHLADQRTHLIAKGRAFIVPVCIDGTRDADAEIPDSFGAVQWTRLPDGETPPAFVERITRLLSPAEHRTVTPIGPPNRHVLSTSVLPDSPAQSMQTIPEKSIAVLPFLDMSAKKDQEHFSDGLAEALIDLLTQVRDLRVPARTSSFYFKGKSEELATIAEKLRVAHILEGSVRKAGNTIRVTAQLIRADSGYHLWSKTYDRDAKDIFKVQDEIAGVVVEALKAQLLPVQGVINQHRTANTGAYEQYLLGKYFYNGNNDYVRAAAALQRAVALDPGYAPAHAWLSLAKRNLLESGADAAQADAEATIAADRAVMLAPGLAEAYYARGYVRMHGWDWTRAQADLEQAMQLDPNDAASHAVYAIFLAALGRSAEAIVAAQIAIKLAPLDILPWLNLGICLYSVRQYVNAREAFNRAIEISGDAATVNLLLALLELIEGNAKEALKINSQQPAETRRLQILAMAEHTLGHAEESQQALNKLLANSTGEFAYSAAQVYGWRGETDRAFECLERAYRQHSSNLSFLKIFPPRTVRHDPRYKALLRKMNLPE